MLNKQDILELLKETSNTSFVMAIHYEGFVGRGINGVMNNVMFIKDLENSYNDLVLATESSGDIFKTNLNDLVITDNYIKAKYTEYYKGKHQDIFRVNKEYFVIVPFDRITSIRLTK